MAEPPRSGQADDAHQELPTKPGRPKASVRKADGGHHELDGPLDPGTMVEQYRVLRLLGRGGMGEVYLARDTWLGRKVALKVLHPSAIGSPDAVDRFLFEARTTARFSHTNIVTIYGVGQHRGSPYVALEFLEGETLRERLAQGPLSAAETVRIGQAIAQGLQEAHRRGILHRDLKPENVMIPRDGRLRVLDFGLAKAIGPLAPEETSEEATAAIGVPPGLLSGGAGPGEVDLSRAKGLRGTPAYMAPEQWLEQPVTAAADLWAIGVILYELLSGRRPWRGGTLQLAAKVCSDQPPPPLQANGAPAELIRLVQACLERAPEARPDIDTVVETLGELVVGDQGPQAEQRPFRGLLAFDERHKGRFFGREAEVALFVERLRDQPVLPVVGPSGAGKSSFIAAGVVPRLREQGPWRVLRLRPGRHPLRSLAATLLQGGSRSPDGDASGARAPVASVTLLSGPALEPAALDAAQRRLTDELNESPARLALSLTRIAEQEGCRVLLLVDQLEELFTLGDDEQARATFLEALFAAADDPHGPVRVTFTLRDDFLGRLAASPGARRALGQVIVLGNPGRDALLEIVTRPVSVAGWTYDDESLPDAMVMAVQGEPAALPMLQVTGQMLWQRRDRQRRQLCRAAYEEMGGVAGALAHHADGVLEGLSQHQLRLARDLLLRLVTAEGTRRILPRSQMLEGVGPGAAEVLDRLVEGRLVLARRAREAAADAEIELVHESLIRRWARLARWLDESREELVFLDEVGQAAELWERRGRHPEELWQKEALWEALRFLDRCGGPVAGRIRDFLAAGQAREQRRRRRRRAAAAAVITALCVLASVLAGLTLEARQQRSRAESRRAQVEREGARAALNRGDLLEARAKLRATLQTEDSALARALWWQLRQEPLRWKKDLRVMAWDLVFSPDGGEIATASSDGSISLLDASSRDVRILRGHQDEVRAIAFSPDGLRLASATGHGEVAIWDRNTGEASFLEGHTSGVLGVDFSPDGALLATVDADRRVRLWQVATGAVILDFEAGTAKVLEVAFSPNGRVLATAGEDQTVRLWDSGTGNQIAAAAEHPHIVDEIAFHPDGHMLASSCRDRAVRLLQVPSLSLLAELEGHTEPVVTVAFSPDGTLLASGGRDNLVRLWDVSSRSELRQLRAHVSWVNEVTFSPDGERLASAGYDALVLLWDLRTSDQRPAPRGHSQPVSDVDFDPDGGRIATAGLDHTLRLWDAVSGNQLEVMQGHEADLTAVAFSPNGERLASAAMDRTVRLWDAATGRSEHILTGHRFVVTAVSFSPDGTLLASSSWDGTTRIWDLETAAVRHVLREHPHNVWCNAFSDDGRLIATGTDHTVRVWQVTSGKRLHQLGHSPGRIRAVRFAPRGRSLAVAGDDQVVQLWDLELGQARTIAEPGARVLGLDFVAGGSHLCGACADGTVRIWSVDGGEPVILRGHMGEANAVRVGPDASVVASVGDDGTLRLWDLAGALPRWRAPVLLFRPPEVLTQLGWQRLDHTATPTQAAAWRHAVEHDAHLGAQPAGGALLCLATRRDTLQLWDTTRDALLREVSTAAIEQLLARDDGCIYRTRDDVVRQLTASGEPDVLRHEVNAIALSNGALLLARDHEVELLAADGTSRAVQAVDPGVTAVTRVGSWLVVGYRGGAVEQLSLDPEQTGRPFEFEAVPSSPVVRLLRGPMNTLIAGYGNGTLGIWSLDNGTRLHHFRLHGPLQHLMLDNHMLYAATQLGDVLTIDLDVYQADRCSVLQEIWHEIPVVWENGLPMTRPPDPAHRCAIP